MSLFFKSRGNSVLESFARSLNEESSSSKRSNNETTGNDQEDPQRSDLVLPKGREYQRRQETSQFSGSMSDGERTGSDGGREEFGSCHVESSPGANNEEERHTGYNDE